MARYVLTKKRPEEGEAGEKEIYTKNSGS